MSKVSLPTIKQLFANSRNECAFEGCTTKLVDDGGVVIGRICHIKGSSPGGPRYDAVQSDDERHSYDNLILLCGPHHDVIDKQTSGTWTVERLQAMKAAHEMGAPVERDDDARVCQQLIQSDAIYEQGIRVGSVHAHTVQMAKGNIYNYRPTSDDVPLPPGRKADQANLAQIIDLLGNDAIYFLREHDFGGSFEGERFKPVRRFVRWHDEPQHEFLNQAVEQERLVMWQAMATLNRLIAMRTFPLPGYQGRFRVQRLQDFVPNSDASAEGRAREHREFQEHIDNSVAALNEAATEAAKAYDQFIRVARRELEDPRAKPEPTGNPPATLGLARQAAAQLTASAGSPPPRTRGSDRLLGSPRTHRPRCRTRSRP
ncbi:MAG: hypothetical protein AAGF11_46320 [Myxococcota bacterium]